jgi:hypothetical protein
MAAIIIIGAVIGIIVALYFVVMTVMIMYYINKGKKESLTVRLGTAAANMPLRFKDECTVNEIGTLRCAMA